MSTKRIMIVILIIFYTINVTPSFAASASDKFMPVYKPQLEVSRTSENIDIDGQLSEPAWMSAAIADNFSEHYPGDQTKPPVETRAYVTYNDDNLYVAFLCYDNPASVRASICERDKIHDDDNVRLCLDTYGNAEYAYIFYVNPYGIQGDAILTSGINEMENYDLIWESSGVVTDSGYQVEIAIPFSTIRFSKKNNQTWNVDFWRNHPRETAAEYSWAALDRNKSCWPCQWGTVSGISGVEPGKGIEIAPSLLAFQSGELSGNGDMTSPYKFKNYDPEGKISLWSKYSVSSNTTVEVTVNPDFSQIESDAGQIDINSTFALNYPERRPFFQEGYDLFKAAMNTLYTRSINDPEFAAKVTWRGKKTSIGYLMAKDRNSPFVLPYQERSNTVWPGGSVSNIIRLKQNVGDGSRIGLFVTDQRFNNGGKAYSLAQDAFLRLSPTILTYYHLAATHTNEFDDSLLTTQITDPDIMMNGKYTRAFDGESFWGHFILAHLQWKTSTWFSEFEYQEAAPTYRQPNGFFRQSGFSAYWIILGHDFRIASGILETIRPSMEYESEWNYHSRLRYRYIKTNLLTRLRFAQASFNLSYVNSSENFSGSQFDDIWYLYQKASLQLNDQLSLSWNVTYGHQIARRFVTLGRNLDIEFQTTFKPSERILIKQDFSYAKSKSIDNGELLYDGYISRTRFNYQISSPLSARLIVEYNDFDDLLSIDPLLTYRINAFSVLYIGMTSSYQLLAEFDTYGSFMESNRLISRQFFAKLQYLFQL